VCLFKFRVPGVIVLALALAFSLSACNGVIEEEWYTLTVKMEGEGEIVDDEDEIILESSDQTEEMEVQEDEIITLIARPAEDYEFEGWEGDVEAADEKETPIKMDQDKEITAIFSPKPLETTEINQFQHENEDRVWSLEFSPDDSKMISGGDESIIVRDPVTGDEIIDFTEHGERANRVTFSSDGSLVASAGGDLGGGTTIVWETDTGEIISDFEHDGSIDSIAFSPDDSMVASGGGYNNEMVRVWDPATGATIETFSPEETYFRSVAFTSDSKRVIAGSADDAVRIWDIETGDLITEFTGHGGEIYSLDISSDDSLIASFGLGDGIKIWEVETQNVVTTFEEQGMVDSLVFSADDSMVVSGSRDETVKIWDVDTGKTIVDFTNHETGVWAVDISSDDSMVASGDDDGFIKVWEWKD